MIRPGLPLAEKLGRIFTAVAGGIAARIDVEVRGEIAGLDVSVLELAALKGVFATWSRTRSPTSTPRCWPASAASRSAWLTESESPDWRNVLTLRGIMPDGQVVSVGGTLSGRRQQEKLVEVNGFEMEIAPAEHMVFLTYTDRPGIVGTVGQILGSEGINIAGMQVCRDARGGARAHRAHGRLRDPGGGPGRHLLDHRRRRRADRGPRGALGPWEPPGCWADTSCLTMRDTFVRRGDSAALKY